MSWYENVDKIIKEEEGCSFAESFSKFLEENKGKFLFSDLKEIINKMSENELKQPLVVEINGPMGPERHNAKFNGPRKIELNGNMFNSTGPCITIVD